MSTFYDTQLDYLKQTAVFGMSSTGHCMVETAFLYLYDIKTPYEVEPGTHFPEYDSYDLELQETITRHKAKGIIFRLCRKLTADWEHPETNAIDNSERDAALIVLIHNDLATPLCWAAADITDIYPHPNDPSLLEESYVDNRPPRLSNWISVNSSLIPAEYLALTWA
ncbi:MAG: hypothetical protein H8E92_06690 [SAR86 cluster bacterium]|nr:hypothetical protein [SAR86 cluster bacterium]